jgi:Putative peptidoglycan binding domain
MPWGTRGRWAVVAAALAGLVAGVFVALQTTAGATDSRAADPSASSASPSRSVDPADDPLGVDAPLVNLDCTGMTILVVGYGNTIGPIIEGVTSNTEVSYLETADSCPTIYQPEGQSTPRWVAYMGPFDSLSEPCSLRMSIDHKRDSVTSLKEGLDTHVQCLCVLDPETFPDLAVGMSADTRDGIYIRSLQQALVDLGLMTHEDITGIYDQQTADMVERIQTLNALGADLYGRVENLTWRAIRDRACIRYDF